MGGRPGPLLQGDLLPELLPELKARGKTVLVISHDDRYSRPDRIVKLENGVVAYDGPWSGYAATREPPPRRSRSSEGLCEQRLRAGPDPRAAPGGRGPGCGRRALARQPRLLPLCRKNPECLERRSFEGLDTASEFLPYPLQAWPTFATTAIAEDFGAATDRVARLVKSVPQRFFGNAPARLAERYRLEPRYAALLAALLARKDYVDGLVIRGDSINTDRGFQCLELNMGGNLGGWKAHVFWSLSYAKIPFFQRFLSESGVVYRNRSPHRVFFTHLIERARQGGRLGEVFRIAFLIPRAIRTGSESETYTQRELDLTLAEFAPGVRGEVVVCENPELFWEGGSLTYRGRPVHAVSEQTFEKGGAQVVRAFWPAPSTSTTGRRPPPRRQAELGPPLRGAGGRPLRPRRERGDRRRRAVDARGPPRGHDRLGGRARRDGGPPLRRPGPAGAEAGERCPGARGERRPQCLPRGLGGGGGRRSGLPRALGSPAVLPLSRLPRAEHPPRLQRARRHLGDVRLRSLYGGCFLRMKPKAGSSGIINSATGATDGALMETDE